jgi:hypothetical protein
MNNSASNLNVSLVDISDLNSGIWKLPLTIADGFVITRGCLQHVAAANEDYIMLVLRSELTD